MARGVDVVVPAHNEAATIEETVRTWLRAIDDEGLDGRVIVAEDGSRDATVEIVERMSARMPVVLLHHAERLGYSRAVAQGIRASDAPLVVCADSDGQCDPSDFGALLDRFDRGDVDVVTGARRDRADSGARRAMSRLLRAWFRALHGIRMDDPSSPFVLGAGESMRLVAADEPMLSQGYWWEFHVRARRKGLRVDEVPVRHHRRRDGRTRVYRWRSLGPLALEHVIGLWRLRGAS